MRLAITGGTGFVGSHLIERALRHGHEVVALTRRAQPGRERLTWVAGDLSDTAALSAIAEGADAVIHVAGVLSAPTRAQFDAGNVAGTAAMLRAASAADVRRFVFVSSLAAREPRLSMYGASKFEAEALVKDSALDWVIVRPPAVYGPGDKETLELFKMAKLGLVLMPPDGRFSIVHVEDLAELLLVLATGGESSKQVIEPDDGEPGGWSHRQFGRALGTAVGRRPLVISAPSFALHLAARADRLVRGAKAKLTVDRAAYFSHRDWVVSPDLAPPPGLWRARIETGRGLRDTAAWYRAEGWL